MATPVDDLKDPLDESESPTLQSIPSINADVLRGHVEPDSTPSHSDPTTPGLSNRPRQFLELLSLDEPFRIPFWIPP